MKTKYAIVLAAAMLAMTALVGCNSTHSASQPETEKSAAREESPKAQSTSSVTMRDLEGVYTADGYILTIFDADDVTATGRFNSRSCAVYLAGQGVGLVFTDGSELKLWRSGTTALTIEGTKTVLYKR